MEKKYVLTLREDVCIENGCLDKVNQLLAVLPKYGTVVPYDTAVQQERDEYQSTIDNLTDKVKSLEAHNLTQEEIKVLNLLRETSAQQNKELVATWEAEKQQLIAEKQAETNKVTAIKSEFNNYKRRLKSIVDVDDNNI